METATQVLPAKSSNLVQNKSEILFLYESSYSIPNGDPFTGEQRYDEETKKVLVSDVRIKRFIRDYFIDLNQNLKNGDLHNVFVVNEKVTAALRMDSLKKQFANVDSVKTGSKVDAAKIMQKCIDVRLFGGISTEEGDAVNMTGPVQFAMLNPSLNKVDLRMHQNTSVFTSKADNKQGAIGTTSVVPYSLNQIHGWINPFSATHTGLTDEDTRLMFKALWHSINAANTRTKSNQNALLLLQIIYSEPTEKIYGLDRLIKMEAKDNKAEEQIRSIDDYNFDFSKLDSEVRNKAVSKVIYYCDIKQIDDEMSKLAKMDKSKFEKLIFKEKV